MWQQRVRRSVCTVGVVVAITAGFNDVRGAQLLIELRGNESLQNTGSMDDAYFHGDTTFGEGLAGSSAGFTDFEDSGIMVPNPGDALDGLQSLTFSMFIKTPTTIAGYPDNFRTFFWDQGDVHFRGRESGRLQLAMTSQDGTAMSTSSSAGLDFVDIANEWMFVAVTADGPGGEVNFYLGTESSGELVLEQSRTGQDDWSPLQGAGEDLSIGNQAPWFGRPVDGQLDNVRLHGSYTDGGGALSQSELEDLFQAGLAEIPEPGTGLLVGSVGALLVLRSRRSQLS